MIGEGIATRKGKLRMAQDLFYYDEDGNKVWYTVSDTEQTAQTNAELGQSLNEQKQKMMDDYNNNNNQKQISIFNKFLGRE